MFLLPKRAGFALVELLVSIALLSIIVVVTTPYLFGTLEKQQLLAEQERLSTALQRARSRSAAAEKGKQYGIRFESDGFIELPEKVIVPYAHKVKMSDSSSTEVFFEKLSGQRVPGGTQVERIQLQSPRFQVQLTVNSQGSVSVGKVENR